MQEYIISIKHTSQYHWKPWWLNPPHLVIFDFQWMLKVNIVPIFHKTRFLTQLSPKFGWWKSRLPNFALFLIWFARTSHAPLMPHLWVNSRRRLSAASAAPFVADVCPTSSEAVANSSGIRLILLRIELSETPFHGQFLRPDIELEPHFENYWEKCNKSIISMVWNTLKITQTCSRSGLYLKPRDWFQSIYYRKNASFSNFWSQAGDLVAQNPLALEDWIQS